MRIGLPDRAGARIRRVVAARGRTVAAFIGTVVCDRLRSEEREEIEIGCGAQRLGGADHDMRHSADA
jgi:hypothetical protein